MVYSKLHYLTLTFASSKQLKDKPVLCLDIADILAKNKFQIVYLGTLLPSQLDQEKPTLVTKFVNMCNI